MEPSGPELSEDTQAIRHELRRIMNLLVLMAVMLGVITFIVVARFG